MTETMNDPARSASDSLQASYRNKCRLLALALPLALSIAQASAQEIGFEEPPLGSDDPVSSGIRPILELSTTIPIQTHRRPEIDDIAHFSTPYTDSLGRLWNFSVDLRTGIYVLEGASGRFSTTLPADHLTAIRYEAHRIELRAWCRKNPTDWIGCSEKTTQPDPVTIGSIIGVIGLVIQGAIAYWQYRQGSATGDNFDNQADRFCTAQRINATAEQARFASICNGQASAGPAPGGVRICTARPVFVEQGALGAGSSDCAADRYFLRCEVSCDVIDPHGPLPD